MKFLERIKYKLAGRTVPVIQVVDIDDEHKVKSITISRWIRRPNSLIESWNVIGAEIIPGEGQLQYTDEKGVTVPAFAEYKGKTHNLYVEPRAAPNHEKLIGALSTLDNVAEDFDLGKSMKNTAIGIIIGIVLQMMLLGPLFTRIFS